jgi:hypothetical protein
MTDQTAQLVYRAFIVFVSLGTWGLMVVEHSQSQALQSVLTMLLGAAAGYHGHALATSQPSTSKVSDENH